MGRVLSSYLFGTSLRFLPSRIVPKTRKNPAVFSFAGDPFFSV